jgi:hypothetical protein
MDHDKYKKLLTDNITQKYKTANPSTVDDINNDFDVIADALNISERINKTATKQAFVTLKDHKENFQNNPKCRLINPTKTELGRVSKKMLDRINNEIRLKTHPNQWTNTADVIKWFGNLEDKNHLKFLVFDIVDFYPSISQELLNMCIKWAGKLTRIQDIEYTENHHTFKKICALRQQRNTVGQERY